MCLYGLFFFNRATPPTPLFVSCLENRLLLTGSVREPLFAERCTGYLVVHGSNGSFAKKGWVVLKQTAIALCFSKVRAWFRPLVSELTDSNTALQLRSDFPLFTFFCVEKNLIVTVQLSKEYSPHSAVYALSQ